MANEQSTVNNLTGKPEGAETETETKQPEKKPTRARKPVATAATADDAEEPTGTKYTVWCPQDKCLPAREIEADSPAEAKEKYMEVMGIITVGHPLSASEIE